MRKIIAYLSVTLSVVFAIALANAEDTATSKSTTSQDSASMSTPSVEDQQAGTTGSTSETTTTSKSTMTSKSKSCTDKNGVTYRKGEKGFDRCRSEMKSMESGSTDQQSGTMGSDSSLPSDTDQQSGSMSNDTGSTSSDTPSDSGSDTSSSTNY